MTKPKFLVLYIFLVGALFHSCSSAKKAASDYKAMEAAADHLDGEEEKSAATADSTLFSLFGNNTQNTKKEELPYNPERTRKHDLLHTKLEVSFDFPKRYLNGTATLTLKPYFYPQNTLDLDAKGFDIKSVELVKGTVRTPLPYKYDDRRVLNISLDKTYKAEEQYTVRIVYTAKPDELPQGGSEAIKSDKGLYFIDPDDTDPDKPTQVWTQGETEASSCWFPTIDSPNERTTEEIYITVPNRFKTLSNGKLISSKPAGKDLRTDYWRMDLPHAPYLFMMAVGEYAIVKDKWRGMDVDYYVEPKFEEYARNIFGNTPEMLEFFSNKLGVRYPWNKFSQVIVRDYVSGAMENTTAVVFGEFIQQDDRAQLDQSYEGIIAHELFHHWFGDLVTCESWANLPLNESFANYSEYLWAEHKYGIDEADMAAQEEEEQYFAEAATKQEPLIRYRYANREDMFDRHSYNKGGRILHMLRNYVGDDAFFKALNLYLETNKFSAAEVHHLRLAFEKVTGEDLNWFFNQWFLSPGHPVLSVKHEYRGGKLILTVKQLQDTAMTSVYRLPLKVGMWVKGKKQTENINITKTTETFEFALPTAPEFVLLDPDQQLLAEVKHEKTEAELISQYRLADRYKARYEALAALGIKNPSNEVVKTLEDALNDKAWKIRLLALQRLSPLGKNNSSQAKERIKNLALTDPKATVRASALNTLGETEVSRYKDVLEKALQDKSYNAEALAFYLLLKNSDDKDKLVKQSESSDNPNIEFLVIQHYAEEGDPKSYDFFIRKLDQTKNPNVLYSAVMQFGSYLKKTGDQALIQRGIEKLSDMAANHDRNFVRFGAYTALAMQDDPNGEIKALLERIKSNETDQTLLYYYNMAPIDSAANQGGTNSGMNGESSEEGEE